MCQQEQTESQEKLGQFSDDYVSLICVHERKEGGKSTLVHCAG